MSKDKIKIFMRGAHNSYNFGDDAIFIAILYFLEKHLGLNRKNSTIYTDMNERSFEKLCYETVIDIEDSIDIFESFKPFNSYLKSLKVPKFIRLAFFIFFLLFLLFIILFFRIFKKKLFFEKVITFFEELDIIHYIGGGYITDRWLYRMIYEYFIVNIAKAINPNIRIIGTGLGIGPFKYKLSLFFIKGFLDKFDYLFLREKQSFNLVKNLNIKGYVKTCGDDVLLLLPLFRDLKHNKGKTNKKSIAFNLKDFPDHDYFKIKSKIEVLLDLLQKEDFEIKYFCFGQEPGPNDYDLLKIFDSNLIKNLPNYNPYKDSFHNFIESLSEVSFGVGFAYHFCVILSILNIPFIAVYSGDYYKQKIIGAVNFFGSSCYLLNMDSMQQLDVTCLIKKITDLMKENNKDQQKIKDLYDTMVTEYISAYKNLIGRYKNV